MNVIPNHDPQAACEAVMALIAAGRQQAAWDALQQLAQSHPQHAPVHRLKGGILKTSGQWEQALVHFRAALALDGDDSQSHNGAGGCLHALGRLPEALVHFREALRCQCDQPKQAGAAPPPSGFDPRAAEATLWKVLAELAAEGVQAFPTAGTLLGLVRDGHLLPHDKDIDIALPFEQMEAAGACLKSLGWQRKVQMQGLVNPQEWHGHGVVLDLCGFLPDPERGTNVGGFWYESPQHPWSRVTEMAAFKPRKTQTPVGEVWQLDNPEAVLLHLYGPEWRVPDPDFDTVVAAKSMRGFTLVTQCYAFARIYSNWVLGRLDKARSLVRHSLRHLPDDPLLRRTAQALGLDEGQSSTPLLVSPVPTKVNDVPARPPRILWANAYCLLDTTSGASMAVRQMLLQLHQAGCDVAVLGATIFDHPRGIERLRGQWERISAKRGGWVRVEDGPITHQLFVTEDTRRRRMLAYEEALWFNGFVAEVERFRPDVIVFYGGQVLDHLVTAEARSREIPVVAFLANGNFHGQRWCRDVDLILTDSKATAQRYSTKDNLTVMPVGAFIDPAPVLAQSHSRQRILFVNPSLQKGAALVCLLAILLEKSRPDLVFEVVESRGDWTKLLREISSQMGHARETLANVVLTPNTADMRPVYAGARVLLAPSLGFESFGRVAAEAVINHIPVVYAKIGGLPEVVGEAGIAINLPTEAHQAPYNWVPQPAALEPLVAIVQRLFDDEDYYQSLVKKAALQAPRHSLKANTFALIGALHPLLKARGMTIPLSSELGVGVKKPDFAPLVAQPPPTQESTVTSSRRVLVNSFVGGFGSKGRVGEALLRHLLVNTPHQVALLPFRNDPMSPHWPDWVSRCVDYRPERGAFDQQIKFCSVGEARQRRLARDVTPWFFHDVDGLPAEYVNALNSNDRVYVCSRFVKDVFERHGVTVPVDVLGHGFDPDIYTFVPRQRGDVFTFLCVAENLPRKNLPMLIRAFDRAFPPETAVRLHLKTGVHDASGLRSWIRHPERVVLDTRLRAGDAELAELYQQADCFVLPTRIEGFGMPILEAMATGLPVIVTDYSGHLDFCNPDNALLIRNQGLVAADTSVFPHLAGLWAEPDEEHLIELMQHAVADYDAVMEIGRRGYEHVRDKWTWRAQLGKVF